MASRRKLESDIKPDATIGGGTTKSYDGRTPEAKKCVKLDMEWQKGQYACISCGVGFVVIEVFQERLVAAFPEPTWAPLVSGLREGVRLADRAIETTPLLNFVTGRDLRGHVRRAGILYHLREMCRLKALPFQAEAAKMPIGCWHWLDIQSKGLVAHVTRTDTEKEIPDITINRQPKYMRNQYDLFADGRIPPIDTILDQTDQKYSTITYGANRDGSLTHAAIGMPSSDGSEWLAFVNLMRRDAFGTDEAPAASTPVDPTQMLKFLKRD